MPEHLQGSPLERVGYRTRRTRTPCPRPDTLPAFGSAKHVRPAALVIGNRSKAQHIADQYSIRHDAIYDY
jgi:hypothetical protein